MQILPAQAKLLQARHSTTRNRRNSRAASCFERYEALLCLPCLEHTPVLGKVFIRTAWLAPGRRGHSSAAIVSPACTTFAIIPAQLRVTPHLLFQMQIRMTLSKPSQQARQCFLGFLPKLTHSSDASAQPPQHRSSASSPLTNEPIYQSRSSSVHEKEDNAV